jgi:hypothetical protein
MLKISIFFGFDVCIIITFFIQKRNLPEWRGSFEDPFQILLRVGFHGIIQGLEQNLFADFSFGLVAAFAKFAFWAERIHGA